MIEIIKNDIKDLHDQLQNHSVYGEVKDQESLKTFMSLHVFCVWDFMSLVKFLQNHFAPSQVPWKPRANQEIMHFINDIVLEEESDKLPSGEHLSHFEMYCKSMQEIGANSDQICNFVEEVQIENLKVIAQKYNVPQELIIGMENTFNFLDSDKPHIAASAFCFGRENVIPTMFTSLLDKMNITQKDAPLFHFYLSRHVQLDGEVHGPMALKMVEILCKNSDEKVEEARLAARAALESRIKIWDFIESQIKNQS